MDAVAEKNAALLTARAGSGDLSAIPSICCVSVAYPAGEFWSLMCFNCPLIFCWWVLVINIEMLES